jgi:hypothetical protein
MIPVSEEEGREFCRRVLVAFPRRQDFRSYGKGPGGAKNPVRAA